MEDELKTVGMDVDISNEALKKASAEKIFNANVVEALSNLGILKYVKSQDAYGVHYRWMIENVKCSLK